MGIVVTRVGSAGVSGVANTVSVTLGATIPVGHKIIVSVCTNTADVDGQMVCTDTKQHPYGSDLVENPVQVGRRLQVFSAPVIYEMVSGDIITVTMPVAQNRRSMDVIEVTDIGPVAETAQDHSGGTGTALSSGTTGTRASADALLLGVAGWQGAASGDVFTATAPDGNAITVGDATQTAGRWVATEYVVVSSTGTDAAQGTLNVARNWSMFRLVYPLRQQVLTGMSGLVEADIVAGGKQIVLTLTDETWIK